MNIIICEKSFVGFLSAVYDSYYFYKNADVITPDANLCGLTDSVCASNESLVKARRVRDGIIKKGGLKAYGEVLDAYLSGDIKKEAVIYDFLRLFFARGKAAFEMHGDARVAAFNDTVRKVRHEIHRLKAFVRLQEMKNGVYYGFFRADNDILERMAEGLAPRFNSQKVILHDYVRGKFAYMDVGEISYFCSAAKIEIELSDREEVFRRLWKQYTETVTIKERENLKLQQKSVPKKYRVFMNEF